MNEALDCIEVWDATGHRVIRGGDALDMAEAQFPDPPYEPRRFAAIVEVVAPPVEGQSDRARESAEFFESREKAEQEAARWRHFLGEDRVRIVEPRVVNGIATRPL